jgi:hypothetical protein
VRFECGSSAEWGTPMATQKHGSEPHRDAQPEPAKHPHKQSGLGASLPGLPYEQQRAAVRPTDKRPAAQFEVLGERFETLQQVHDHLQAVQPSAPEVVVRLTDGAPNRPDAQTTWHYYQPGQKIVLDGVGRRVDGERGGRPTLGYFLSYRPIIGEGHGVDRPAAANLEVRNLTIRGFQSGGIEISPQTSAGPDHHWDGGQTAFLAGAHISGVNFRDLGSKQSAPGDAAWSKLQFGAGGVMARGLRDSVIEDSSFVGLENGVVQGAANGGRAGPQLQHAIYLNNQSGGNTIRNNRFETVSGDPIRISNGSHGNRIQGNRSEDAGKQAFVSDWFNNSDAKNPQTASQGTVFGGNKIGRCYGSERRAKRFHRKESQGARPDLAL